MLTHNITMIQRVPFRPETNDRQDLYCFAVIAWFQGVLTFVPDIIKSEAGFFYATAVSCSFWFNKFRIHRMPIHTNILRKMYHNGPEAQNGEQSYRNQEPGEYWKMYVYLWQARTWIGLLSFVFWPFKIIVKFNGWIHFTGGGGRAQGQVTLYSIGNRCHTHLWTNKE